MLGVKLESPECKNLWMKFKLTQFQTLNSWDFLLIPGSTIFLSYVTGFHVHSEYVESGTKQQMRAYIDGIELIISTMPGTNRQTRSIQHIRSDASTDRHWGTITKLVNTLLLHA